MLHERRRVSGDVWGEGPSRQSADGRWSIEREEGATQAGVSIRHCVRRRVAGSSMLVSVATCDAKRHGMTRYESATLCVLLHDTRDARGVHRRFTLSRDDGAIAACVCVDTC